MKREMITMRINEDILNAFPWNENIIVNPLGYLERLKLKNNRIYHSLIKFNPNLKGLVD